ncbi:putative 60S ribosomal protein L7a [Trypanosoma grayi]|uniref:putative 60S ribosomal protein L7a n=1 Tax=Trypanosoma grayi TaxID=71804 RepID=UPI0004F493E0|nr:putative 60S ribosomal protein L7a [Trypanosoma grayi]KEG07457.1 putative 60S ribosomal protein L7a [Trypanosoma grayi]
MDAYQSLSNRVASMEDLLRRSESALAMALQRIKTMEEYISASEARQRGEGAVRSDAMASRLERVAETNNSKMESLQEVVQRQANAAQVADERLQAALKVMEQRFSSDIAGCYQRMQASEASLMGAVRNVEGVVQSQSSTLKSLEQIMRGDMHSMQQKFSGELGDVRQHADALDRECRNALVELHRSISGDVKSLSDNLLGRLQSSAQTTNAALAGLEQKISTDMRSLQEYVAREISADRQKMNAQEGSTRDALQALHGTLAGDIANLSSRFQAWETSEQVAHQQLLSELSSQRQQMETVDSNWRVSLADINGKVQEGWQSLRAQQGAAEIATQQALSQTRARVDELASEFRCVAESFSQPIQSKFSLLETLREDMSHYKRLLASTQEEHRRLRDDLNNFSLMADRSAVQLRSIMEAAVRASHSDMLERMKPLTSYRAEMNAAITAALSKMWNEIASNFTSQRDIVALQNQIQVLDHAVRNEVSLLVERGRALERRAGEPKADGILVKGPQIDSESGAVMQLPILDELNSLWVELRSIQKRAGMPREEVLSVIGDTRKQILEVALDATKKSEDEFRALLARILASVHEIMPKVNKKGTGNSNGTGKRTVIRVMPRNGTSSMGSRQLQPLVGNGKMPSRPSTQDEKQQFSSALPLVVVQRGGQNGARDAQVVTVRPLSRGACASPSAVESANRLPPLAQAARSPAAGSSTARSPAAGSSTARSPAAGSSAARSPSAGSSASRSPAAAASVASSHSAAPNQGV